MEVCDGEALYEGCSSREIQENGWRDIPPFVCLDFVQSVSTAYSNNL